MGGAYAMLLFRELPAERWWIALAAATAAGLCVRATRTPAMLLLGMALLWAETRGVIDGRLEPALAGRDLTRAFRVVDFPERRGGSLRLLVAALDSADLPERIRLSWFEPREAPQLGECWRLIVRLRRPRGLSNPGAFDYEGWLLRQSIGATGYVRGGKRLTDCEPPRLLTAIRGRIAARLSALLPADDATAVLLAITVGARHEIGVDEWRRYATTGTSHLMAISGLHIGLAAGGAFMLAWCLLAVVRPHGNHRDGAAIAALVVAVAYAAVSGFAVPARRALTMLAVGVAGILMRRAVPPARLLGITCLLLALQSPLDVLSPGFQLSFGAVATLLLISRQALRGAQTRVCRRAAVAAQELGLLQVSLLFGLLPLNLMLFDRAAWLAPAVNLLVLPVFNLISVPAALAGTLLAGPLEPFGDAMLKLARHSVALILDVVDTASRLPNATVEVAELDGLAALASWLATLWVLLPVGWPGRRIACLAALTTVLHSPDRPPAGCADVHALDVGQGLSTVVLTRHKTLVFDAGPAYRSGTDAGQLVVAPFLRSRGVARIDMLIVSHADSDHAGGAASLASRFDVGALLVGELLPAIRLPQHRCRAGQVWHWEGVTFAVLHPDANAAHEGNNASCVLELSVGRRRALLTGDIETPVELALLYDGRLSRAELVLVPHHGSVTSSHAAFVERLRPRVALASAGFDNRWRMPRSEVVDRWRGAGSVVLRTSRDGAVSLRLCRDAGLIVSERHRIEARRFWHEP